MPLQCRKIYLRKMPLEEARSKLRIEIEKAFLDGVQEIEIIHGIGNYILHDMVIAECSRLAYLQKKSPGLFFNPGSSLYEVLAPEPNTLAHYVERS